MGRGTVDAEVRVPRATPLPDEVAEKLDAKERMVVTAARLFQRQGYHATGLKQVVTEAKAPRGSIYHHFPGGKEELGVQAVHAAASELTRAIRKARERSDSPGDLVRKLGRSLATWLEVSEYHEGCPISTVTLETAPASETLTAAVREAYRTWTGLIVELLADHDVGEDDGHALATTAIAAIEGALLLCRAEQDTTPMREVTDRIADMLDRAVAPA